MPPSKNSRSSMSMATGLPTASRICKCANCKKSDNDFTCNLCRRYTAEGKALYMVAALGVVMDTTTCQ